MRGAVLAAAAAAAAAIGAESLVPPVLRALARAPPLPLLLPLPLLMSMVAVPCHSGGRSRVPRL